MAVKLATVLGAAGVVGLGAAAWLAFRGWSGEKKRPLRPGDRILVMGDSYAVGLAPYLGQLAQQGGYAFRGIGCPIGSQGGEACTAVVGSSVTQWVRDAWLGPNLAWHPTLVLVSLGGNDFQRSDPQAVSDAIKILVAKIRLAGADPVWIDPLPLPFADKLGVRDMWKATGIPYFNGEAIDYPRAPDNIHLQPSGYQDWAGKIWSWLGG